VRASAETASSMPRGREYGPGGKRAGKAPRAAGSMFAEYETNVTSRTQVARRANQEEDRDRDPKCCCCASTSVLIVCNTGTFILSLGLVIVGAFINNEVSGWGLRPFDIVGNLCLGAGGFMACVSIIGIMAGKTTARALLFLYFIFILLVSYLLILALTFAAVESGNVDTLVDTYWPTLQQVLGMEKSPEEVEAMLEDYMFSICGISTGGLLTLTSALVATVRLLGLRAIAYCCLWTLCILGVCTVYGGVETRTEVPAITTYLLYACGAVQLLCGCCGLVGLKSLNRECMRWFFLVLLGASGGLAYVCVNTYLYIRDHPGANPEHMLLVFGIAMVCDFFLLSNFVFGGIYYCKRKGAFQAADKAHELPIHYSSNHKKFGKYGPGGSRRKGGKGKSKARQEYASRNAL